MVWFTFNNLKDNIYIYEFTENCIDDELINYFEHYQNLITTSNNKISIIFNLKNIKNINTKQLWRNIQFINNLKDIHREKLKNFVLIFEGTFIQNITDMVFIFSPPVVPYLITDSIDNAIRYLE